MALNLRDEKAIKIFSKINEIEKITNNRFSVKSQTTERWYVVEKLRAADVWTCECRDFMNRLVSGLDVRCKHIMACQMLQDSVREASGIESVNLPKICPKCNSSIVTKHVHTQVLRHGATSRFYAQLINNLNLILW